MRTGTNDIFQTVARPSPRAHAHLSHPSNRWQPTQRDAVVDHYSANGTLAVIDGVEGGADGVFQRVLASVVLKLLGSE